MKNQTAINDLSCATIDVKPIDYDWSDTSHAYGDAWEFYEAITCEKCDVEVVTRGDCKHCDATGESPCDGYLPLAEGPMMSYYYPLPGKPADIVEAAKRIAHLPLCIVEFIPEESYALALTGGGMDLSWEICEAFMLLGHLPPLHFADLPGVSGRGISPRDRWIAAGCLKSCQVAAGWAVGKAKSIKGMLAQAKRYEAEKTRRSA